MDKYEFALAIINEQKETKQACDSGDETPYKVGEKYLFRGVTNYNVGEIEAVYKTCLKLKDASWVADCGRFSECLKTGSLSEVEPYPSGVIIHLGALVDAAPWKHKLPKDQK